MLCQWPRLAETRTYVAALRVCQAMQTRAVGQRGGYCYCPTQPPLIVNTNKQFLRHPHSPLILQLNPSRKLGMFSVGDGAPRSGRRVIVSDPGQPLMTGSVHPVPAPRLLLLTMWCYVVLCGAVWCRNQRYCVGDCLLLCPCVCSGICRLFAGIDCEIL